VAHSFTSLHFDSTVAIREHGFLPVWEVKNMEC